MLVLARKTGEIVRIGETIELKIMECTAGHVRIGFAAPAEVRISRGEARERPTPRRLIRPVAAVSE